jgi:hypothetical protein
VEGDEWARASCANTPPPRPSNTLHAIARVSTACRSWLEVLALFWRLVLHWKSVEKNTFAGVEQTRTRVIVTHEMMRLREGETVAIN